jgi:hypothetical protein
MNMDLVVCLNEGGYFRGQNARILHISPSTLLTSSEKSIVVQEVARRITLLN